MYIKIYYSRVANIALKQRLNLHIHSLYVSNPAKCVNIVAPMSNIPVIGPNLVFLLIIRQ